MPDFLLFGVRNNVLKVGLHVWFTAIMDRFRLKRGCQINVKMARSDPRDLTLLIKRVQLLCKEHWL